MQKKSIYFTLSFIIITTVSIIMSLNTTYNYKLTKNKIIEKMKKDSENTAVSLKNSITNLLASYSINEYDQLIFNEIEQRDIFAIIIKDFNMGKIIGEKAYISGKIKYPNSSIINYNQRNKKQNIDLENCYFSKSYDIKLKNNHLGSISIYISDFTMEKELNKLIEETILNAILISLILIITLFLTIHFFILKPISNIVNIISNTDKEGLPLSNIPDNKTKEISLLSSTINNMIESIKSSRISIKENEHRLEYLLEMSPIAVRIAKNRGEFVIFANKAYSKLLHQNSSNTSGQNPKNYYDDILVYEEIVSSLEKDENIYNKLVKLKIENKIVWALASYMNIIFDGEKAIIGWFYDVTKEKETEVELFKALELQTTIFDNSGYLIIRVDKNGIIKQVNKEVEKLLGYSSEELVDQYTPEIFHLEKEILHKTTIFSKELNKDIIPGIETFIAKTNAGLKNEHEWTYLSKDGKHIPVLLSITALKTKNNKIYGYLGIAQNISERKKMESQAKLASMGEMIGNIAHQWRQPLSIISTIATGIQLKSEFYKIDSNEILDNMKKITYQTQYLSKTIDDFRNFIKNTNTKELLKISSVIEKTLSIVNSSIKNNNINLILEIKDDLEIKGFENQLIQAFINIINNAKDSIKENVLKDNDKLIFIQTEKFEGGLSITIKDSGSGIKNEIIDKIFEPYFTTKHQSIGTGIGLSMVHQIINDHHYGKIEVSNVTFNHNEKKYTGACFKISFYEIV